MTDTDRIQALEDHVAALEEALGLTFAAPAEWKLSGTEERIFGMLRKGGVIRRDRMMTALWWDRDDPPNRNTLHAHICNLGRKLRPLGYELRNVKDVGYSLGLALKVGVEG